MNFRMISILIHLSLILCSFVSCAPTSLNVKKGPTYESRISTVNTLAVVNDFCLVLDHKEKYVSLGDSIKAKQVSQQAAIDYLTTKGYVLDVIEGDVVGSFVDLNTTYRVAQEKGMDMTFQRPPFVNHAWGVHDYEFQRVIINLIRMINASVSQDLEMPAVHFSRSGLSQSDLDIIKRHVNTDAILVVCGEGMMVPFGKTLLEGVGTGVLTGVITGGFVSVSVYSVSYLNTRIGLVDLTDGQLLWSNKLKSSGENYISPNYYNKTWANTMLYHLDGKEKTGDN